MPELPVVFGAHLREPRSAEQRDAHGLKACLAPLGIEALHPDEFLLDLVDLYPIRIVRIVEEQAAALRNPKMSYEQVLDALARSVPETVARLREL